MKKIMKVARWVLLLSLEHCNRKHKMPITKKRKMMRGWMKNLSTWKEQWNQLVKFHSNHYNAIAQHEMTMNIRYSWTKDKHENKMIMEKTTMIGKKTISGWEKNLLTWKRTTRMVSWASFSPMQCCNFSLRLMLFLPQHKKGGQREHQKGDGLE